MAASTKALLIAALAVSANGAAMAAPASMTSDVAQAVVQGCRAHAAENDQAFAIAVVDAGGHLVAYSRMDGASAGAAAFSQDKAKASAIWGFATSRMAEGAENTPGFASAPYVVTVAGGLAAYAPDAGRIGAVGVSGGAPSADEACAQAGLEAAGLKSSR